MKGNLDQFYTSHNTAKQCYLSVIDFIKNNKIPILDCLWLEPSAGEGAFYNLMPENKIGIDIDPKIKDVIKSDFLNYNLPSNKYITIGNPPFGKNSSLAIKFFNKCAVNSELIAFIVPKTFKKKSVQNKLCEYMHLKEEINIENFSFIFEGKKVNVPCVFQIWKKEKYSRGKSIILRESKYFDFVKKDKANIAFQRVGVNAGRVKENNIDNVSASSHYFLLFKDEKDIMLLKNINWNEIKYNTAGNPSISKSELIEKFNENKKA